MMMAVGFAGEPRTARDIALMHGRRVYFDPPTQSLRLTERDIKIAARHESEGWFAETNGEMEMEMSRFHLCRVLADHPALEGAELADAIEVYFWGCAGRGRR
jgi:hypothetical protein